MITLYDIPSTTPQHPWSPNTWKTRFTLNYKNLPHKTEWIEYPDITALYKAHNIAPTRFFPDGSGYHSLPVIKDEDELTGEATYIAESLEIARYLDKKYPGTPRVVLEEDGTEGAFWETQKAFPDELRAHLFPFYVVGWKGIAGKLSPRSAAHFKTARANDYSAVINPANPVTTIDDLHLSPEEVDERWERVKQSFDEVDGKYFGGKGGEEGSVTWFSGDRISFADFVLGGFLLWIRDALGEESEKWQSLLTWSDGKWKTFLERLGEYQAVN
ncbi:hypothetical protein FA15DRAFT_504978 [Coprinopsis marcescibilis]|uniref:GST N-terminal domain-containing protein n=1 Tax=Coprinopsis marcescibilis TaxID=230819 RepID=A0A5C3KSD7_COPMA|nr:hypothetical protein FA15DRAFT_504978 [Coprinopsis marcescibilis]